jgi:hypothetical protein
MRYEYEKCAERVGSEQNRPSGNWTLDDWCLVSWAVILGKYERSADSD